MGGWARLLFLLFSTACAATLVPVRAWAPETRIGMVDEAVRLMPASLRAALEHHREALLRGVLEPMTAEDGPEHRPAWAAGSLDRRLAEAAETLQDLLAEPTRFDDVARGFGDVAHWVADAGFPPGASRTDGRLRYQHFSWFCEDRRERFPVVFYGHADPHLDAGDYRGFAGRVLASAGENDASLARAYAAAGDPPDPAAFDDRSVPFAVASLAYSQSMTHIVRVWIAIWDQAGGDMARIPYREPASPGR
jgi:hypothetical protein